jgi:hypothetical protein
LKNFLERVSGAVKLPPRYIFEYIFLTNGWGGASRSGPGSDLLQTQIVRNTLPKIIRDLGAKSLLDIPCGDFYWMKDVELNVEYIGADVVPSLIRKVSKSFANERRTFLNLDILTDAPPPADLVLSRDLLVHLSFKDIFVALENLSRSKYRWILTTTFPNRETNADIRTGEWRPLNLQAAPFNFPNPQLLVNEGCTEQNGLFRDKSLALWDFAIVQEIVLKNPYFLGLRESSP